LAPVFHQRCQLIPKRVPAVRAIHCSSHRSYKINHQRKCASNENSYAGNSPLGLCGKITVTSDTLLERMLDPQVKLGTSTPKADPSGDYAFEAFRKAEAVRSNARSVLENKALQLTGGVGSAVPPAGRNPYGWHIAERRADMFLAYCTAARDARKENADLQTIALPDALAVSADYGLTVMADASPGAYQFALFILSSEGQRILAAHGFSAPGLSP